jgi:xanthine dehydrogenase YagT iron-sulfur-binding subunit
MPKEKIPEQGSSGISRRDFFKNSTAGAVSTALISRSAAGTDVPEAEILGPGKVPIILNVNGKTHRLSVEPRVTLLDALRERLDITSCKKVCDEGTCGACTVLLDGKPVYACSLLAIEGQGKQIITAEGLGTPENMHPIQEAFVKNDAQQCGFCTPGFVVASKAFLEKNPNPTLEDIEKGMGGNLCRCGTYPGIKNAILEVASKGGRDA